MFEEVEVGNVTDLLAADVKARPTEAARSSLAKLVEGRQLHAR